MKIRFFITAFLALIVSPCLASQNATTLPTTSPYAGITMLNNINSAFDTFQTNFSGGSAPSSPKTFQLWTDTTNKALKLYDGTSWLPLGDYDDVAHKWNGLSNTFSATTFLAGGATSNAGQIQVNALSAGDQMQGYYSSTFFYGLGRYSNGLALDSADKIYFFTGSATPQSGVLAMTLDATGNLGIGKTPSTTLDVAGTTTLATANVTSSLMAPTVNVSSLTASQLVGTDGAKNLTSLTDLPNGTTATTQSAGDNSTKVATTAYADAAARTILRPTQNASTSSSIDFTSIPSGYNEYEFVLTNVIPATNGAVLYVLVSDDNGATWKSANYAWGGFTIAANNATGTAGASSDAQIKLCANSGINNSATFGGASGRVIFNSLSSASVNKTFMADFDEMDNVSVFRRNIDGGGWFGGTTAINAIRFKFSSGNISSGTFSLYGRKS